MPTRQLWVLFAGPVAVVLVAVRARFIRRRRRAVRRAFALGAALFVGGALGAEVVEIVIERRGWSELTVAVTLPAQEVMELTGAVVLLHASLTNLRARCPTS